jgi:hypothetical protein
MSGPATQVTCNPARPQHMLVSHPVCTAAISYAESDSFGCPGYGQHAAGHKANEKRPAMLEQMLT